MSALPATPTPPVLVAGAGPVGLATALLLAGYEIPTVVLEARAGKQPSGSRVGSRAICMQRDVLDLLDRVGSVDGAGIGATLAREGVTWRRGVTYYRGQELFETTFPEVGASAYPPFVNISQSRTEELLLAAVARQPLIELRYATRVTAISQDATTVTVRLDRPRGESAAAGSHLVAADGSRSQVRQLLGIPFEGVTFDDQFLIADIRAQLPFAGGEPERRFFFDPEWNPGRQVLVHPQPDSVWRIDWQVPGDFDLEAERASGALDTRIRRIVGDADYELVWLSAYRFSSRLAARFLDGRVLLAGDAAHLMSPFGARGLNSGLQDAENAGWKLGYVRSGWAPPTLLDSYDLERRAAAEENLRVTAATIRFLVPSSEQEWAHRREVLERAVHDPSARPLIDSGKLAEPFWYVDSPLTTPPPHAAGSGSDSGAGSGSFQREPGAARPPVPGVLCPDGPVRVPGRPQVTRLRQLLGRAFVVLVSGQGGGYDPAPLTAAATKAALGRPFPVEVVPLDGPDGIDVHGALAAALRAAPGSVHVVRPDGHLAGVLPTPDPDALVAVLRRALTLPGDADELARRCAETMYAADRASQHLGIVISDVGPGRATARMRVTDVMVQGHGSCHGGYLFLLADSAFAFACNTYDQVTVAAAADIVFVAPAKLGDELVAEARERARYGRSGIYDVSVRRADGTGAGPVIAEFRGNARSRGTKLLDPASAT